MLAPQALLKGLVARALPFILPDGPEAERFARMGRYGDLKVEPNGHPDQILADEGSYFTAPMTPGQTAIQLGLSAAFSAVAAAFVLVNGDGAGGKRGYLRSLRLAQSVAPTSGVDLRYAVVLDGVNRTPTTVSNAPNSDRGPGTAATATAYRALANNVNQDDARAPVCIPYFPFSTAGGAPPTVPAASAFARTIVGGGYLKNSIPVVKDQYVLQFGSVDRGGTFQGAAALAKIVEHAPPIVIGPGQSALIYLWSASNITAGNAWDDVALDWIEK